ncbi:MAG: glycosyltransferase family 39 protein [Anaerolineae bacterium]|nr:glycosyltransferase family 39 protein [Anaerolineae bacterium]
MTETEVTSKTGARGERWVSLILVAILLVGAGLRFYNVNWDEGTYHIHPDERSTTMVVDRIEWPSSIAEYFDTSHSPLNARNVSMVYFYGTFPLYLTKAVASSGEALQNFYAEMQPDPGEYWRNHQSLSSYDRIHLVGRVLSALFDLGTVILSFFLARRLFDWRVGLIAAALLTFTVLNIQGSHYFAVDTFLTFFVALTLWFTLDVAEGGDWQSFVNLGLAMGLTLASKVSVFLLVAVIALAAWVRLRRHLHQGQAGSEAIWAAVSGLALAALVALALFRIAQPYAWAGPNYDGWDTVPDPWGERLQIFEAVPEPIRAVLMPNPQWIADIVSAGAQQTGEADLPWGRQWTERAPWLWPLENMILWTLGVPLGVTAWLGVLLATLLVALAWLRRRPNTQYPIPNTHPLLPNCDLILLPLAWILLTFGWQGMQYVKSVRYFLPIHPYLAMFAAFLVVAAWDWARRRHLVLRFAAATLGSLVVVGTVLWAFAFIQIYTEPVTRVQATEWIYQNVESGATLRYRTLSGEDSQLQLPLSSTQVYAINGEWRPTPFTVPQDLVATEVVMNDLSGELGAVDGAFEVRIVDQGGVILAEGQVAGTFDGDPHVVDLADAALIGGATYYFESRALEGAPLVSHGAMIANEHFDDPLPFNMFGYAAFGGGLYRSLDVHYPGDDRRIDQLQLYDEDTPEKLQVLLDSLDQADYIIMSSGRLWQSIPRLPMRYPVTTRYYELLFAGELGFEKAAEFHSYPRLFGIEFDDTWAEEQFTVYDHPKVLIYRKTDDFDRARVERLLSAGIDWDNIPHWLNPRDLPEWRRQQETLQHTGLDQNDLMLGQAQWELQQESGTWASLFDRNSLFNRLPTLSWLLLLALVGLAALPLTLGVFGRLPDRGYILARPVGVLLVAWLSWILTNLTPLHYTRGNIALALALIAAASATSLLLPAQRQRLRDLGERRRLVLVSEILFLAAFALFWFIRWGNPDLWHPWKGGEKPMDFAYLNAVIKSVEFPPYDPWFAGGYLNYYYFGQVMAGTLIKLIGIVPNVAYNLVLPAWFAMTATGAFSVTYNLIARRYPAGGEGGRLSRRALLLGLAGALFVAVLGNLAEVHLILLKLGEGVMEGFESTIPGLAGLVRTLIGTIEVFFGGRALPIALDQWYWNASRAIPGGPYESVITEFPFFTYLYADLHAHLLAMPLTFLSLAVALAVVLRTPRTGWQGLLAALPRLLLWALAIGAMRTTNTWDVPPHLLLVLGALVIAAIEDPYQPVWRRLVGIAWQFGLVFLLSWSLLYKPFWDSYGAFYNSVAVWTGTRTPLWAYLVVHGLFLFALASYLFARVVGDRRRDPFLRRVGLTLRYRGRRARRLARAARVAGVRGVPLGCVFWLALAALVLIDLFLLVPGLVEFTRPNQEALLMGTHAYRGLVVLALGLPLALMGLLLLFRPHIPARERLWAYLVLLGLAMSLGVEVIVLEGDIGRMNTVFKFYLQVWLMWGVAAAAALAWMVPRLRHWRWGQAAWIGVLGALLFFAALYPPLATSAKVRDRFEQATEPGLDGWHYMETSVYWDPVGVEWGHDGGVLYDLKWDLEAIRWLLDNVVGTPVILEGHVPEYRWGARYSINTGLPTVIGWNWHQRQQRAAADQQAVWDRAAAVRLIYDAPAIAAVEPLLQEYDVRYVVVGPLERAYYDEMGLEKFDWMVQEGKARAVFSNERVTIYELIR